MEIEGFMDLVKKRRNIRRLKSDSFPDEYVDKILETARWAMSGANAQPWEFVVVKKPETRDKLVELMLKSRKQARFIETSYAEELRQPILTGPENVEYGFEKAPVIIVVCADPRTYQASVLTALLNEDWHAFYMNIGNATFLIHLAAAALGLDARWVSVGSRHQRAVKDVLGIPDPLRVYVIVPIGYRAYDPAPSYRRDLSEIVHYEKYDQSKYRTDEQIRDFILQLRNKTRPTYRLERT